MQERRFSTSIWLSPWNTGTRSNRCAIPCLNYNSHPERLRWSNLKPLHGGLPVRTFAHCQTDKMSFTKVTLIQMLRLTCSLCFRLWKTTWIELHECCCTLNRCALCSFSLQVGRLFVLSYQSWTKLVTINCSEYSFQYFWWAQQRCNLEKLNRPKQCHKSSFCHHSSGNGSDS